MHITPLALVEIRPNPHNPRGSLGLLAVQDLTEEIRRHGLLQPLVVRRVGDKAYEVVAGHRRLAAVKALEWSEVPCHVLEDEAAKEFEALLIADQLSHRDLPLFGAAEYVKRLIERDGMTTKGVADQLGKSERWVAQRQAMATLNPRARKEYERESGCLHHWTVEMLEALAEMPVDRQGELLVDRWWGDRCHSLGDVQRELAREMHMLKHAPFDIHDGTLLPKAGPCDTCQHHSHARPGLFEVDEAKAKDLRKATCLLAACFVAKTNAHAQRAVAEAKRETPGVLVVHGEAKSMGAPELRADIPGALDPYSYTTAQEGQKGAKPAYVVDGKGAGKTIHVILARDELARVFHEKAEKKPLTNEERQARLDQRRGARAIDLIREGIATANRPLPGTVARLLLVFGAHDFEWLRAGIAPGAARKAYEAARTCDEAWGEAVWPGVRLRLQEALTLGSVNASEEGIEFAYWLARDVLDMDTAAIRDQVEQDVPTPKVLQQTTGAEAAPAKASKRKAPKGKGKAAPAPKKPAPRRARGKAAAAGDRDTDE